MVEKGRKPWLAGILTFATIGLGHLYGGRAKKGVVLFFLWQALLLILASLIYFYTPPAAIGGAILVGFVFTLYAIVDAVRAARSNRHRYTLKKYNRWYIYLGCWILTAFILQPIVASSIKLGLLQAYRIPAGSLEPTLLIGDHILTKKWLAVKQGIHRGDIVIFAYPKDPSKDYIKRVVALGGESIEMRDKQVYVNGEALNEPYVQHIDPRVLKSGQVTRDNFGPFTVPQDALFVLGDNRDASNDSRFWGFLPAQSVKGKAHAIYWSWDKGHSRARWDRIGQLIR